MYVIMEFTADCPYVLMAGEWDVEGILTVEESGQCLIFKTLESAEQAVEKYCDNGKAIKVPEEAELFVDGIYYEDLQQGVIEQ